MVILGGGIAGWMTASYLGRALGPAVNITVLEAPAIPEIGAGEATAPNLHTSFFDFLGISEEEWMRECNASFRMGTRFVNWRTPGTGRATPRPLGGGADHFDRLFGPPAGHDGLPLTHYWTHGRLTGRTGEPYDYACYRRPVAFDHKLSPRRMDGTRWTSYAWHFDAHLVADFLCRFAVKKQGATHIEDQLTEAVIDRHGHITALRTKAGRAIEGELFVDCSGVQGLLINQAMREPFLDLDDHLLNDRAVTTAVPHDDAAHGVEPFTSAIAMSSGWTWKIPMPGRFGTGYVYSSRFGGQDEATGEFCRMWGLDPEIQPLNHLRYRAGRNRRAWVGNCVSIGPSCSFLEPLGSTGVDFIHGALCRLVKHFPDRRFDPMAADRFNQEIEAMFADSRDFVQSHFRFAPREDTPFWRACKELKPVEELTEKVRRYRAGDMPAAGLGEFWSDGGYHCVLAGLGFLPGRPPAGLRREAIESAEAVFAGIKREQRELVHTAPPLFDYLRQLHWRQAAVAGAF